MNIPLSNPDITEDDINSVLQILRTPTLSIGPKIVEFEKIIADYTGVKYAVAVNSGTSALHLIVRSLCISENDEVITTPFSFISSSNCLLFERAKPVFVDIDPTTLNIDADKIEKKITQKTKAILAVDVFGYPAKWDEIKRIAKKHNLKLIEDSCEALGAEYRDRKAGSFGHAGCFAFYPNKQITTGEGGIIVTDDKNIFQLCRSMRNQGRAEYINKKTEWLDHKTIGYNYRISEINCALGISQMKRIDEILKKRKNVANIYNQMFANIEDIIIPHKDSEQIKRSWFVYVICLSNKYSKKQRDNILQKLRAKYIECSSYFTPIHLQPFYKMMFGYKKGDFPITESIAERSIALPFFNNLKEEQIKYVAENLIGLLGG